MDPTLDGVTKLKEIWISMGSHGLSRAAKKATRWIVVQEVDSLVNLFSF